MSARKLSVTIFTLLPFVLLLPGCALFESMGAGGSSSPSSASTTGYAELDERIKVLSERVAGLETRDANRQRDLADVQTKLNQLQGNPNAAEIQQLKAQVQALEAQREKDKQIILDQVAKEIAGMAGSGRSRSSSGAGSSGTGSGGGSDVGYEHIVKQGQTLTDIAKAYGVTVAAIKKANNLTNDSIRIGQKLFIPKS